MRVLIINKFLYPNGGSETYIYLLDKINRVAQIRISRKNT